MFVITAAAGSSAGPTRPGETNPPQGGGCGHRAIAAEEFRAIRGHCLRRRAGGQEGDLAGEAAGPGVPGQDGTGLRIALADHLQRSVFANGAEHPFGIKSRRQAARPVAVVSHGEAHQLDRGVGRDEHQHILIQLTTDVGVASEALAMADGHGSRGPHGKGVGVQTSPVSSSRR